MATKIKKSEFVGIGALIQLIGVIICFFVFPVGLIAGLVLVVVGNLLAYVWKCSQCRGKVDKEAMVCPHCRADFTSGDLANDEPGCVQSAKDWADALKG